WPPTATNPGVFVCGSARKDKKGEKEFFNDLSLVSKNVTPRLYAWYLVQNSGFVPGTNLSPPLTIPLSRFDNKKEAPQLPVLSEVEGLPFLS
ncbi:MAG: hypothetical protein U9Q03_05275, partial [Patescibacteria group bacterium]|nr:hypothetical protein [Patescibacteria group bacterium]